MIKLYKSPVTFEPEGHTYSLNGKELFGVTSTLIRRAFPNKYSNIPESVLSRAAEKGHQLHEMIEFHDKFGTDAGEHDDERIGLYESIKQSSGLRTIANEYLVSDEEHYASSIDIVMLNDKDEICLADIKTTYNLDNASVALQLSIYKRFFERQNPELKVAHLYALWLPNKDHTIVQLHELDPIGDDVIDGLIEADLADRSFDISVVYGTLPTVLAKAEKEIVRVEAQIKSMKEWEDKLKSGLYDMMSERDMKSFTGSMVRLTRVLPTTSETFDTKRFKKEHPDLYKEYTKTSDRAGSLKITIL